MIEVRVGKIPDPTQKISGSNRIGLLIISNWMKSFKPDRIMIGSGTDLNTRSGCFKK